MNKTISTPLAITVITILTVLIGGTIFWQSFGVSEEGVILSEETTDESINWEIYQNKKSGYEIKYPSGWIVVTNSVLVQSPDIQLRKENKETQGDFALLIQAIKISDNDLKEYVQSIVGEPDEIYEKYCSSYVPYSTTLPFQINGKEAIRVFSCGIGGGIPSEETFVFNEKSGVVFQFSCLIGFEGYPDYSKYYSSGECDKILKTFQTVNITIE